MHACACANAPCTRVPILTPERSQSKNPGSICMDSTSPRASTRSGLHLRSPCSATAQTVQLTNAVRPRHCSPQGGDGRRALGPGTLRVTLRSPWEHHRGAKPTLDTSGTHSFQQVLRATEHGSNAPYVTTCCLVPTLPLSLCAAIGANWVSMRLEPINAKFNLQ